MINKGYYAIIPADVRYDRELSANAKLLYGEITALCNERGYCWATNQYFADLYDMSTRHISRMISQLSEKGYISLTIKDNYERHIYLGQKCPTPLDENVHPPLDKNVLPPHDKNVHKNNTVINTTKINNTSNKKSNEHESEFELLWKQYPRKKGKEKALKSYLKARKNDSVSYERVQDGLKQYKSYIQVHSIGEEFIKHGSTWFGNSCWDDEYNLTRENTRQGFYGLYMSELDKRDIIDYDEGGGFFDTRGSIEIANDYSNLIP